MKKLLLSLLIIPACSYAQIEIGVNAGTSPLLSSKDKSTGGWTTPESSAWPKSGTIEIVTVSYGFLKVVKVGIGYEFSSQLEQMKSPFLYTGCSKTHGNSELYAGIKGGIIDFNNSIYSGQCSRDGYGHTLGLQIAYSYRLFNELYLNGQTGIDVISASAKGIDNYAGSTKTNSFTSIPVTIGIHYKILTHKNQDNGRSEHNRKSL